LLVFLLVSGQQTFRPNSAIPNEGIEQMTRQNDGACADPKQRRRARFRIPEPRYSRSVSDARIHDLRHTFASGGLLVGEGLAMI
jgi:hypothetical protein